MWRPQVIHCMNDRSTLSVLVPAKESAAFPNRLRIGLAKLLLRLGVAPEIVEAEVTAMGEVAIAPTNNRSILGCMRDAALAIEYAVESGKHFSLEELEMRLTTHIHGPTGYARPGELAVELLSKVAHA